MARIDRPLLLFDGDCHFCRRWIEHWKELTGEAVAYEPFQEMAEQFPQIPRQKFEEAVQLIEPDGTIYAAAHAVFQTLSHAPGKKWLLDLYQKIPGFKAVSEWFYGLVARHRSLFSALTSFFWGRHAGPQRFLLTRSIFLKCLGFIYLIAFLSLWCQLPGLVGSNGILPVRHFLEAVKNHTGPERYYVLPTLCWLNPSDGFLQFLGGGGVMLSGLLILEIAPVPVLFFLWIFYLSLSGVCREFLGFQWDALLLETGFLAIFLAPAGFFPKEQEAAPPSWPVLRLFRWLLFRLMFSSGVVKLASGDPSWRHLTALTFHYETQPLPCWISWYAHQLPLGFQKFSAAGMFFIEIVCPFLIFAPRRLRLWGAAALVFFQLLIMATGNYGFFNLLTVCLCVLLVDDEAWPAFIRITSRPQQIRKARWPGWIAMPVTVSLFLLSLMVFPRAFRTPIPWPSFARKIQMALSPFSLVNSYGLFAVMTTSRPEIIVEGSYDGKNWIPYEFKYKPGDLKRYPGFVAPHMPRLDWQMWFAALGNVRQNLWFVNFCVRLLQGSPEVTALLAKNPFPGKPPRYIRAMVYDYHFTDVETRKKEGLWWQRTFPRLYIPPLSLK